MKNALTLLTTVAIIFLLSMTLAAGIGVVHNKHESRRLSIVLENLQVEENELELEWQQLQLEQSTLTADASVDQIARNRLQMIVPRLDEIKYISASTHKPLKPGQQ